MKKTTSSSSLFFPFADGAQGDFSEITELCLSQLEVIYLSALLALILVGLTVVFTHMKLNRNHWFSAIFKD